MLALLLILATNFFSEVEDAPTDQGKTDNLQVSLESLRGEYYRGDGLGYNTTLTIESNGRFSYKSRADVGYRHERQGTVEFIEGTLIFTVEKAIPPIAQSFFPHPKLRPVVWGRRCYLLEEREFSDFCNAVNLGLEPRDEVHGWFYVRLIQTDRSRAGDALPDIDGKIEGVPELPSTWRTFLIDKPLQGEVTEVLKEKRATVNIGSEEGLKEGMRLMVVGKKEEAGPINRHYGVAKVLSIDARQCTIEFVDAGFSPEFRKGQQVSSRISNEILGEEERSSIRY
jgi:hypothetical protein